MSPASPKPLSPYFGTFTSRFSTSPTSLMPSSPTVRRRPSAEAGGFTHARSRSIQEKRIPLKRVLTGESVLEGGKDKNSAWKLIIIRTASLLSLLFRIC